jgi:hypothetical protein
MEKMTNVKALSYILTNCELPEDVKSKVEAMKASYEKKASAERKPTPVQTENAGYKAEILAVMADGEQRTITDLMKAVPSLSELSNQRVSAIVRQMTLSGEVVRIEDKRKAYFKVAE